MEFVFYKAYILNRIIIITILLLLNSNCYSQKIIERDFDATLINSIDINSDIINSVFIHSEKTNHIKIIAKIEGEHYENVVLSMVEKDNILFLKPDYTPFFEAENDKLAAHKVQSIDLEITVPEDIEISITSLMASVSTQGKFKAVKAFLGSGNCNFQEFVGDADLKTKGGSIVVSTKESIFAKAVSKNGIVINQLSENKNSKYTIIVETNMGDISLFQIH